MVPSGDKLKRGQAGVVMGHPPSDSFVFGKGLCVRFPGNKNNVGCLPTELSRGAPLSASRRRDARGPPRGDSGINQAVIQRNPDPYVFYE